MNIKKCDRCGKVENPEPLMLKINDIKGFAQQLNDIIQKACTQIVIGNPPVYKISIDEKELDLCEECRQELREWFEHPAKTTWIPYEDEKEEEIKHGEDNPTN